MVIELLPMRIKPYKQKYFDNCVDIIESNTPKYILPIEHLAFKNYLLKKNKTYFVLFNGFNLVACGGYGINDSQTKADLSWGLVHRKHHSQGIGSYLLRFRIENIKKKYPSVNIHLDTSQHTYKFFERFGFKVRKISKDGYGEGLDMYDMILDEVSKK
tara:strand:+ start:665 stop:1138 length:474 start_codon:yes stop_codon:yes gene_type:complete